MVINVGSILFGVAIISDRLIGMAFLRMVSSFWRKGWASTNPMSHLFCWRRSEGLRGIHRRRSFDPVIPIVWIHIWYPLIPMWYPCDTHFRHNFGKVCDNPMIHIIFRQTMTDPNDPKWLKIAQFRLCIGIELTLMQCFTCLFDLSWTLLPAVGGDVFRANHRPTWFRAQKTEHTHPGRSFRRQPMFILFVSRDDLWCQRHGKTRFGSRASCHFSTLSLV